MRIASPLHDPIDATSLIDKYRDLGNLSKYLLTPDQVLSYSHQPTYITYLPTYLPL